MGYDRRASRAMSWAGFDFYTVSQWGVCFLAAWIGRGPPLHHSDIRIMMLSVFLCCTRCRGRLLQHQRWYSCIIHDNLNEKKSLKRGKLDRGLSRENELLSLCIVY
ncbi:hypothetical protein P175DRAFT_0143821 [Aspergillus ochraceoroseus IBT 24754]|uniref:Uncharacterized protein n=1 Tax=Aspergillus ochraceoroseus IBT 24754 TaxID=1392256 RepID=A0A2T5M2I6_9EURO|nr:uncharacterized protein P175DRAFT_0143821 [Aspergillus ochraceoroseus IBT 24754]PTU22731.1 hypothetical protein P175DRAFT_0143821 [Aspergillus ochraceoroseus IBT 24754]